MNSDTKKTKRCSKGTIRNKKSGKCEEKQEKPKKKQETLVKIKIKLPKIYSRFKDELKKISKKNQEEISEWVGYYIFSIIFYAYLLKKYKYNCLVDLDLLESEEDSMLYYNGLVNVKLFNTQKIHNLITQILKCLSSNKNDNIIVIPLFLINNINSQNNHYNLLIYRKDISTLEHYEPYGVRYNLQTQNNIELLVTQLSHRLSRQVKLINPVDICPNMLGFQYIEERSTLPKTTGGFCLAWSLFFTELVFSNPTVSAKDIQSQIFSIIDNDSKNDSTKIVNYFRNVINGYTHLLDEKLVKYFSKIYGHDVSIKKICDLIKSKDYTLVKKIRIHIEKIMRNKVSEDYPDIFENITPLSASSDPQYKKVDYPPGSPLSHHSLSPNSHNSPKYLSSSKSKKKERCRNGTRRNKKSGICEDVIKK